MSSGRFMLPSSATVVPFTFSPFLISATGNLTSGVQVYEASRWVCPAMS